MKEVRYDTANKKSTDSFFDENPHEYSPLQSYPGDAKFCLRADDSPDEKRSLKKYFLQAVLFFPGTFFLFFISLGTASLIHELVFNPDRVYLSSRVIPVYMVGFFSILMTWFGLGEIKNKKHLVIPGSIIAAGATIGAFVALTERIFWISGKILDDFSYAVWLFPFALIVPFLAKGWVDKK